LYIIFIVLQYMSFYFAQCPVRYCKCTSSLCDCDWLWLHHKHCLKYYYC